MSEEKAEKKEFARLVGQSFLTKIFIILLRLTRNSILARVLGPADRGLFTLVTSLPELIMSVGNAGIANSAAYHTAQSPNRIKQILGNTNLVLIALSTILIILGFIVVQQPWLVRDHADAIEAFSYFIVLAIPLILFKVVNSGLLNVLHRVSQVNLISLLDSLSPLILFLLFWLAFGLDPIIAATWGWFLSLLFTACLSTASLRQGFPISYSTTTQKTLLEFGAKGYFDTLFQKLLLRIDFIFVSSFIGNEALGYYAMATTAAELLLVFPNSLTVPLFSFFMRNSHQNKDAITGLVLRVLISFMALSAIGFAIIGKLLIWILFGEAYLPAYQPLLALLPGMVFLSYCSLIRLDLLGRNRPGTVSMISGGAVILNIALNMSLVSDFGIVGIAASSTISYLLAAVGLHYVHKNASGMTLGQTLLCSQADIKLILSLWKRNA